MQKLLGQYTIIDDLTASNNSAVYLVAAGAAKYVVKQLRNTSFARRELEINQILMARNPSHIARLYFHHIDAPWMYLFFEQFAGNLLKERPIPRLLLSVLLDSGRGLVEMHETGVRNYDIKPENIVLSIESKRCAFCDFGGAKMIGESPTESTPDYAAPEVLDGQPSETAPVYSWALSMEKFCTREIGRARVGINIGEMFPWVGKRIGELLIWCCRRAPSARPSPKEVLLEVVKIVQWSNSHLASDGTPILP